MKIALKSFRYVFYYNNLLHLSLLVRILTFKRINNYCNNNNISGYPWAEDRNNIVLPYDTQGRTWDAGYCSS